VVEEEGVALFGEVVTGLVESVDGAFDFGDVTIGGAWIARAVFYVPKVEVGPVLAENDRVERVGCGRVGFEVVVPESDGVVMQGGDFDSGKVKRVGHGLTLW